MPKDFNRTRRVAEQMQRDLAILIQQEIKDPRLGMVTVSGVDVSRDLSLAKVYVTVMGENPDIELTLDILQKASGFLRHELGRRSTLRSLPQLKFFYDESISRGAELSELINEAIASDEAKHKD
ncbi:MAG: 30S ribosome-binding factor RbfA [Gammaproteobacteria bacterium]